MIPRLVGRLLCFFGAHDLRDHNTGEYRSWGWDLRCERYPHRHSRRAY